MIPPSNLNERVILSDRDFNNRQKVQKSYMATFEIVGENVLSEPLVSVTVTLNE